MFFFFFKCYCYVSGQGQGQHQGTGQGLWTEEVIHVQDLLALEDLLRDAPLLQAMKGHREDHLLQDVLGLPGDPDQDQGLGHFRGHLEDASFPGLGLDQE